MRRKQDEELRRLEQALLEDIPEAEDIPEEDPSEWVDEFYEELPEAPAEQLPDSFTVYNTDRVDVDLDSYSEEVYQGKRGGCLIPGLITLLALSLLTAMGLWLLRYLGVM